MRNILIYAPLAVVLLLAAACDNSRKQAPELAGGPDMLEQRQKIEAEYGVKDAIVKYDTYSEMMAEPERMGAEYYMYDFSPVELTPAPEGYKPVYITHIGRHGARYALGSSVYEDIRSFLEEAARMNKLTAAGKNLYERYEKFYPSVAFRGGELTQSGQRQLREIAEGMYSQFPEVFEGPTHAEALSTSVHRVLISMMCFLDELRTLDKDFGWYADAGDVFLPATYPNSSSNPYVHGRIEVSDEGQESAMKLREEKVDAEGICSRFFTDIRYVEMGYGCWDFVSDLKTIISDIQCLDGEQADKFEDIFTKDEFFSIWEVRNYTGYLRMGRSPLTDNWGVNNAGGVLFDMMEKADRDLESGDVQLSLRFSHDSAILPLVSFMRLDNFGAVVSDPEDVKNWWRSDGIPMASNLQIIFYRNQKAPEGMDDTLVKVLYNSREAALPLQEVCPTFYSWKEFKEYYSAM